MGGTTLAIVLNWRQADVTLECVAALRRLAEPGLAILVLDNGSGDGSAETLRAALAEDEFRALPQNLGFAGGVNQGLRLALEQGYEFALLINNDAFPAAGMLARLLAETAEDIALLSPKILYEAEPERIWFAGGRQDPRLLELRGRGQGALDGPQWDGSRDVDYLLGTCLLVTVATIRNVGLLDERFFMYYEDLDWSIRCRQAGYRLRLVGDARLLHRVAVSSGGAESPTRRYQLARSSVYFFGRHAAEGRPWLILLYRIASAAKTVIRLIARGRRDSATAYIRGLRDGWRLLRKGDVQLEDDD
jgi:GT2 family glycosyltransferase